MLFDLGNFLSHVKNLVTGGGRDLAGNPKNDAGFLIRSNPSLASLSSIAANSSGGSNLGVIAAGAGVQTLSFQHTFIGGTSAVETVTNYTPGFKFKILSWSAVTSVLLVGAGGSRVANMEINTTDVGTVPSTVTVVVANAAVGTVTAGTAVAGANTGSATDTISIEIANGGTQFTAGSVTFQIVIQNMDVADAFTALAQSSAGVADETNAVVLKVEENDDAIGNIVWAVPRDYDEATDVLILRVLASQLTLSTDNDVQLDSQLYKKRAGVALSADLAPAAPSTVLSTTEQWVEFDYTGNSLQRDDVLTLKLLTDGHNDTDGEEVLIHGLELVYRSCLVSYDDENDAKGHSLR